jgi:hypothetical protein
MCDLARETGIGRASLYRWMAKFGPLAAEIEKRSIKPSSWSTGQKLQALLETQNMRDEVLGEYLRKNGLRWRLIKNDCEMYVPYSQIKTMHVWKFKRGTKLTVWVYDTNSNERLKWYLLLISKRPDFFEKIEFQVKANERELANYEDNFATWLADNNLERIIPLLPNFQTIPGSFFFRTTAFSIQPFFK